MSKFGESAPPPLPPPRRTPILSSYTPLQANSEYIPDDYDMFSRSDPQAGSNPYTFRNQPSSPNVPTPSTPPPLPRRPPKQTNSFRSLSYDASSMNISSSCTFPPPLPSTVTGKPLPPPPPTTSTSKAPPPPPPISSPPPVSANEENEEDYESVELPSSHLPTFESHPSDGMSLLQFINKYQDHFPIAFEVSLGFSARCEEASISEGERFIANFLKRSKVLTVEDDNKEIYTIPLNTSFQFALMYDPNENKREAMVGFIFKTAGDLMLTRTLPKVIRARKAFRGISPESSVVANELLYVKEVVQKLDGSRRYVKCIQASSGKEKQLHEECAGEFSTSPHDIREYLPCLLKHFQLPFRAVMCLGIDNEEDIPSHLVSAVVTVSTLRTEESLITTSISDDDSNFSLPENDAVILNDIPLTYDINIKILQFPPLINEQMLKQTEYIFNNFNPAKVFPYMANYSSSQLSLMKSVRKEFNMSSVELLEVKTLTELRRKKEQSTNVADADSLAKASELINRVCKIEDQQKKFTQKFDSMSKQFSAMSKSMDELRNTIASIASDVQSLHQNIPGISKLTITVDKLCNILSYYYH